MTPLPGGLVRRSLRRVLRSAVLPLEVQLAWQGSRFDPATAVGTAWIRERLVEGVADVVAGGNAATELSAPVRYELGCYVLTEHGEYALDALAHALTEAFAAGTLAHDATERATLYLVGVERAGVFPAGRWLADTLTVRGTVRRFTSSRPRVLA